MRHAALRGLVLSAILGGAGFAAWGEKGPPARSAFPRGVEEPDSSVYTEERRLLLASSRDSAFDPLPGLKAYGKLLEELQKKVPENGSPEGRFEALFRFLFREKRWKPLPDEPSRYTDRLRMDRILATGQGEPEPMALLCHRLASRVGIPTEAIALPGRLVVRIRTRESAKVLDLYGDEPAMRDWNDVLGKEELPADAEKHGYLQPLSDPQQEAYLEHLQGRMLAQRGAPREAEPVLRRAIETLPLPEAGYWLAVALIEQGKVTEAAGRFSALADREIQPLQARSEVWLARLALADGKPEEARGRIETSLRSIKAADPVACREAAQLWLAMGEPERAFHAVQQGLLQAPTDPGLTRLGEVARVQRELRQASGTGRSAAPTGRPAELLRGCASADPQVRDYCLRELGRMREPAVWEAAQEVLDTAPAPVRSSCVRAFPRILKKGALSAALTRALQDPDAEVRAEAVAQIAQARLLESRPELFQVARQDSSADLRRAAVDALAQFENKFTDGSTVQVLIEVLRDPDPAVREHSHKALEKITRQTLEADPNLWAQWWVARTRKDPDPAQE